MRSHVEPKVLRKLATLAAQAKSVDAHSAAADLRKLTPPSPIAIRSLSRARSANKQERASRTLIAGSNRAEHIDDAVAPMRMMSANESKRAKTAQAGHRA